MHPNYVSSSSRRHVPPKIVEIFKEPPNVFSTPDDFLTVHYDADSKGQTRMLKWLIKKFCNEDLKLDKDECHCIYIWIPPFDEIISRCGVQLEPCKMCMLNDMPPPNNKKENPLLCICLVLLLLHGLFIVSHFCIMLKSDLSCHISHICSHMLGIFKVGGWNHSIYMCLFGFSAFMAAWYWPTPFWVAFGCCLHALGLCLPCLHQDLITYNFACFFIALSSLLISISMLSSFIPLINCSLLYYQVLDNCILLQLF